MSRTIDVPKGTHVLCTDCRAFAFIVGEYPHEPGDWDTPGLRWSDVYGVGHCEHEIGSTELAVALTVPAPEEPRP